MEAPKWRTGIREGCRTMTTKVNNVTVTLHRPHDLSDEERRRREDQLRLAILGLAADSERKEETAAS